MNTPASHKPNPRSSALLRWGIMAAMLLGLPPAGIALNGGDVRAYLEFPPITRFVPHAPFSWAVFSLFAAIDLLLLACMVYAMVVAGRKRRLRPRSSHRWPSWGWVGLAAMLGGWIVAWTRWPVFAAFQDQTFALPWIGYIILVNAWCTQRSGRNLFSDNPGRAAALIPASAAFWWFFEYLNRFVQNWYYEGVEDLNAGSYTLFASLAFATVLPAVLSTYRLLLTFAPIGGLRELPSLNPSHPRRLSLLALILAAAGLLLIGIYPDALFALIWVSPLVIIVSLQALNGRATIFAPLRRGDWRPIVGAALAALICGFFWEMWNIGSLARWHYAVPYVDRYAIFAMPILGYGGYLPFGLECLAVGCAVLGAGPLGVGAAAEPACRQRG